MLSILFPQTCLICGAPLVGEQQHLCTFCLSALPRTGYHLDSSNPAIQRFWGKVEIEQCYCFCHYEKDSDFSHLIHQIKYRNNPPLGRYLAQIYASEIAQPPVSCIIPVPLHPFKRLLRGYNQCEWIARGIAEVWHIPIRKDCLVKTRHNSSQTKKSLYERFLNTSRIYKAGNLRRLEGEHILLVDDVLTSGSTLESCAHILENIKGIKISIFTLAIAE